MSQGPRLESYPVFSNPLGGREKRLLVTKLISTTPAQISTEARLFPPTVQPASLGGRTQYDRIKAKESRASSKSSVVKTEFPNEVDYDLQLTRWRLDDPASGKRYAGGEEGSSQELGNFLLLAYDERTKSFNVVKPTVLHLSLQTNTKLSFSSSEEAEEYAKRIAKANKQQSVASALGKLSSLVQEEEGEPKESKSFNSERRQLDLEDAGISGPNSKPKKKRGNRVIEWAKQANDEEADGDEGMNDLEDDRAEEDVKNLEEYEEAVKKNRAQKIASNSGKTIATIDAEDDAEDAVEEALASSAEGDGEAATENKSGANQSSGSQTAAASTGGIDDDDDDDDDDELYDDDDEEYDVVAQPRPTSMNVSSSETSADQIFPRLKRPRSTAETGSPASAFAAGAGAAASPAAGGSLKKRRSMSMLPANSLISRLISVAVEEGGDKDTCISIMSAFESMVNARGRPADALVDETVLFKDLINKLMEMGYTREDKSKIMTAVKVLFTQVSKDGIQLRKR